MRLATAFKCRYALFELRLFQQVCVTGQNRHIFREVHAVLLVHRALVDGSRSERAGFELCDESSLAVEKIELVGVQRFLNRIDYHIHLVVGIKFGYLVTGTDSASLTLLQIAWTPRTFQLMNRDSPALGVYACSEHTCRTEQNTDIAVIHSLNDSLS